MMTVDHGSDRCIHSLKNKKISNVIRQSLGKFCRTNEFRKNNEMSSVKNTYGTKLTFIFMFLQWIAIGLPFYEGDEERERQN